ncbi:MAG: hypothetical protein ACI9RO_002217 [Alteromonas macleodii]|jgi:hypothetical protein
MFTKINRLSQLYRSHEHMVGKDVTHEPWAIETNAQLGSIDGSKLSIYQCRGQSDLVVNTAAQCAFILLIDGKLTND